MTMRAISKTANGISETSSDGWVGRLVFKIFNFVKILCDWGMLYYESLRTLLQSCKSNAKLLIISRKI